MALIETMHALTLAKVLQSLCERGMPSRASDFTADDTERQSCNVLNRSSFDKPLIVTEA